MWFLKTLAALCMIVVLVAAGAYVAFTSERITREVEKSQIAIVLLGEEVQKVREQMGKYEGCETNVSHWIDRATTYGEAIRFLELAPAYSAPERIKKALELATRLDVAMQAIAYACK